MSFLALGSVYESHLLVILILCLLSSPLHGEDRTVSPTIQEVKAKHADRLLAMPGVVSVGIGQDPDGQFVIVVGLDGPAQRR